jgi:hypothetical protein
VCLFSEAPCLNKHLIKIKMKKYLEPEMEILELETIGFLAASIGDIDDGGVGDGEYTGNTPGETPGSPGWGSDY